MDERGEGNQYKEGPSSTEMGFGQNCLLMHTFPQAAGRHKDILHRAVRR